MNVVPAPGGIRGTFAVPGDKSISHRALLLGALADGTTVIEGISRGADVTATRDAIAALGIITETRGTAVLVHGAGGGFASPARIDCANSGTTMRLLMGMLTGRRIRTVLDGDASLRRRPMRRVAEPLRAMGAVIGLTDDGRAPVRVEPSEHVRPLAVALPVASAQVKSAVLLAGLCASGRTSVTEPLTSRDHTERLLPHFGIPVAVEGTTVSIEGGAALHSATVHVPGDPSSAAFWLAGASLLAKSDVTITGVSLNPTRLGFVRALEAMGANIAIDRTIDAPEPYGSMRARTAALRGIALDPAEVPAIIDELPLLAVVAAMARGTTTVRGAAELRVKESDRLAMLAENFREMGLEMTLFDDGFAIEGPQTPRGARIRSAGDHRIAMAFSIAALCAKDASAIDDPACVGVSYPDFFRTIDALVA